MTGPPTVDRRASLARSAREVEALLPAIAEGSQAALAELYDRCHRQVFALALRIVRDRQLAEEILLDVFLQVWRTAASFDSARGRAFHWLLTVARSRSLDALRSRRARHSREAGLVHASEMQDGGLLPHERAQAGDRSRRVQTAIFALPADQAQALDLAYYQDLTHAEIAARLGVPLGTIKTRIRLGMLKLREKLKTLEDER